MENEPEPAFEIPQPKITLDETENGLRLEITVAKTNSTVRFFMIASAVLFGLLLPYKIIDWLTAWAGFKPAFLLIFGLFFFPGFFFFRLWLWHLRGKEVFLLAGNTVEYWSDYGLFRRYQKHLDDGPVEVSFLSLPHPNTGIPTQGLFRMEGRGFLMLNDRKSVLKSRIIVSAENIEATVEQLKQYLAQNQSI